jgi:beta-phosphoglucomutase-like phosphatase (HAD superfamily)
MAATRCSVATSASKDDLGGLLGRAEIKDLVDTCASGDTAERSKPDPDIILAALRLGRVPPEHDMMLGDTPYGLRCGAWDEKGLAEAIAVYHDPADLLRHLDESPIGQRAGGRAV